MDHCCEGCSEVPTCSHREVVEAVVEDCLEKGGEEHEEGEGDAGGEGRKRGGDVREEGGEEEGLEKHCCMFENHEG